MKLTPCPATVYKAEFIRLTQITKEIVEFQVYEKLCEFYKVLSSNNSGIKISILQSTIPVSYKRSPFTVEG